MIVIAIIGTICALVWSAVTVMANGMSDAPGQGFQGVGTVALGWVAWYFN